MSSLQRIKPFSSFAAVAVAAITAAIITGVSPASSPSAAAPGVAGRLMLQVLRDEHALATAQSGAQAQATEAANREADANLAQMKLLAARESAQRVAELKAVTTPPLMRLAAVVPTPPRHRQAIAQTPQREAQLERVLDTPGRALQEPLRLAPATLPAAQEHGTRLRMRAMMASVTRIPGWFGQAASNAASHAADWVVELPSRALVERRFFSVSL